MYTSSEELTQELEQLSGWKRDNENGFTLGFLLRMLPPFYFVYKGRTGERWYGAEVTGSPNIPTMDVFDDTQDHTLEDAAVLLCILLFKQNILKRETA